MRALPLVLLFVSLPARADRGGPPPRPLRIVKEQPCDAKQPKGGALVGNYRCQLAIAGAWQEPYACEIIRAPADADYAAYFRFAERGIACSVVGTLTSARAFDGSLYCVPAERDMIGHESLFETTLRPIAGGFRIDVNADVVKTYAYGPEDAIPRATRDVHARTKLALNACRVKG